MTTNEKIYKKIFTGNNKIFMLVNFDSPRAFRNEDSTRGNIFEAFDGAFHTSMKHLNWCSVRFFKSLISLLFTRRFGMTRQLSVLIRNNYQSINSFTRNLFVIWLCFVSTFSHSRHSTKYIKNSSSQLQTLLLLIS